MKEEQCLYSSMHTYGSNTTSWKKTATPFFQRHKEIIYFFFGGGGEIH